MILKTLTPIICNFKTRKNDKMANTTKVITGVVRLSYAHIWQARTMEGSTEAKYSVSLLIRKSDKKTKKLIDDAIEEAKKMGKESKWGGKIPKELKIPLRDGDTDRDEDMVYEDCWFINASSSTRPGIVDRDKQEVMDQEEVYSGCYAIVSITFFPYNYKSMSLGIGCGLNHIMKVKDGERLGGRVSVEEDFKNVDTSEFEDDLG